MVGGGGSDGASGSRLRSVWGWLRWVGRRARGRCASAHLLSGAAKYGGRAEDAQDSA